MSQDLLQAFAHLMYRPWTDLTGAEQDIALRWATSHAIESASWKWRAPGNLEFAGYDCGPTPESWAAIRPLPDLNDYLLGLADRIAEYRDVFAMDTDYEDIPDGDPRLSTYLDVRYRTMRQLTELFYAQADIQEE